jgi:CHC2 zinc finger/RepB DNA-primase from phage plasmid
MRTLPAAFEAVRKLAAAIAGGEPGGGLIEMRWSCKGGMDRRFFPCRDTQRIAHAAVHQGQVTDTYLSVAPRRYESGKAEAVDRVWTLVADCDSPEAVRALRQFRPLPSIVIRTGSVSDASAPNCHAYWPLGRPLAPAASVTAKRRIAHALGSDPKVSDPARVMRVPGSVNTKNGTVTTATCVALDTRVFEAGEVVDHLDDPPELPHKRVVGTVLDAHDPLRQISATEYVPALTGRHPTWAGKITCPFHGGGEERTPSFHVYDGDGGWYCFGCERGGTIIDLGALLYGIEPRGPGYHEVRRRLADELLAAVAA